jgi:hypothetical protein
MALPWLDSARYADTHGYLIDSHREMWRWRDWVIDAFNHNMPFDQFTIEQLAGDLIPGAALSQQIASGFGRNHMVSYENGVIPEAYRVEYVADRVATMSTIWLGQTLQCARCHDHKYDPFTMREYYQLFAFFNNIAEQGRDGNLGNAAPFIRSPTDEQQRQMDALRKQIARLERSLAERRKASDQAFAEWEASAAVDPARDPDWRLSFDQVADSAVRLTGTKARPDAAVRLASAVSLAAGKMGNALLCDGDTRLDTGTLPLESSDQGLAWACWLLPTTVDRATVVEFVPDGERQSMEVLLDNGCVEVWLRVGVDAGRLAIRTQRAIVPWRWQHVLVSWDGGKSAAGLRVYHDGQPLEHEALVDGLPRPLDGSGRWSVGGRAGAPGFRGMIDEFELFAGVVRPAEGAVLGSRSPVADVLATPASSRTAQQRTLLHDYYLARFDAEYRRLMVESADAERALAERISAAPTTMVMQELAAPRVTHVLERGEFDRSGERVSPGTPAVLPPFPADAPANRLGLARWLVHPDHPLTARVVVNRTWQLFFGQGLVRTPEDFGRRGEPPTHPELLDWLAVEFIDSGWDMKHLVRLMVSSATYRQSSRVDPATAASDPENRLLARAPRLRLEAEAIRDAALFASGLLDQRLGGPSVFPYQPPGLWEELSYNPAEFTAQAYVPSRGRDLYRRSLYTFWKRTLPPPNMAIFDAPTRETCTVARLRTNTPLQALVLMNDPTFVEAARQLAERTLDEAVDSQQRVAACFRRVTGRAPDADECAVLLALKDRQLARFRAHPQAAEELLAVGSSAASGRWPAPEHAAWTTVASVVLSLDEAITRN